MGAREDAEDCDCKTVPAAGRSTDTLGVTDLLRDLASSDSDLRLLLSLLGSGEPALGSVSGGETALGTAARFNLGMGVGGVALWTD